MSEVPAPFLVVLPRDLLHQAQIHLDPREPAHTDKGAQDGKVSRLESFSMGTLRLRGTGAVALCVMGLMGCGGSPFYVATSTARFTGASAPVAPPTIVRTAAGESGVPLRSVAVLWPDACTSTSYGAVSGVAPAAEPILSTDCGVLMESVELALGAAGFRVVSWDAVRRRALAGELSPEQAAAALGVQGLVRIATLESFEVLDSVEFTRTLTRADRAGNPLGAPLDSGRSPAAGVFPQLEQGIVGVVRRAITLVAAVTLVPSGEVVWHFRGTMIETIQDGTLTRRALVECGDEIGCVIRSAATEGSAPTVAGAAGSPDPAAAARFVLIEETLAALAAALRDGRLTHHCNGLEGSCTSGQPLPATAPEQNRGR